MIHLPILRQGRPYKSLTVATLDHVATGEPVAEISMANPGLISRDLQHSARNQGVLRQTPVEELLEPPARHPSALVHPARLMRYRNFEH